MNLFRLFAAAAACSCFCTFACIVSVYDVYRAVYTRKSLSQMSRIYSKIFLDLVSKIHHTHTYAHTVLQNITTRSPPHTTSIGRQSHTKFHACQKFRCHVRTLFRNLSLSRSLYVYLQYTCIIFLILCRSHSKCMRMSCGVGKALHSALYAMFPE